MSHMTYCTPVRRSHVVNNKVSEKRKRKKEKKRKKRKKRRFLYDKLF